MAGAAGELQAEYQGGDDSGGAGNGGCGRCICCAPSVCCTRGYLLLREQVLMPNVGRVVMSTKRNGSRLGS
eukprot:COSAG01_NODE_6667_length_3555_cov_33.351273_1_plen_71_part_00